MSAKYPLSSGFPEGHRLVSRTVLGRFLKGRSTGTGSCHQLEDLKYILGIWI